jgi:putative membrane protein
MTKDRSQPLAEFATMSYEWIKAFHVIAVISWMAGMLYLPRLFVYHANAKVGSELSETLKMMELRLLRFIINPAMIATLIFGVWMLTINPGILKEPFMHVKLMAVVAMIISHVCFARYRRAFALDRNTHSAKFFRIWNEVPTFLMIIIVIMIVAQPGT